MAVTNDMNHIGPGQQLRTDASHRKDRTIVPISEEAKQGAIRIDLGWRSWVGKGFCSWLILKLKLQADCRFHYLLCVRIYYGRTALLAIVTLTNTTQNHGTSLCRCFSWVKTIAS